MKRVELACGVFLVLLLVLPLPFLASAARAAADLTAFFPGDGTPEGWSSPEPAKIYAGEALFRHIDGGAEVYLERGFVQLGVKYYSKESREVSVEIYDMGSPKGAT